MTERDLLIRIAALVAHSIAERYPFYSQDEVAEKAVALAKAVILKVDQELKA